MLKIGDFSKLANVTVKTLRHYAELGLLLPDWTDRYTGYRYYSLDQLPRLNRILALKDLGLSLEQIARVLAGQLSAGELRGMLALKQAELQQRLAEESQRLVRVEARLRLIEQEGRLQVEAVVVRPVEALPVALVRQYAATQVEVPDLAARAREEIERFLSQAGLAPDGRWLVIDPNQEYLERRVPVEVAVVLADLPGLLPPSGGRVLTKHLPALTWAAVYVHSGPPADLPRAYTNLYGWVEANGYRPNGPARQVYLTDSANPPGDLLYQRAPSPAGAACCVEVQLPVEPITLPDRKDVEMEPEIIEYRELLVTGPVYEGRNENQEIAVMWQNEFMPRYEEIPAVDRQITYGVCQDDPKQPGAMRYMAAAEIARPENAPSGMQVWRVPAGRYAVFKHTGALETLGKTYEYIYNVWMPKSGFRRANRPDLEVYNQDFKDFQPDSVLYLYVPIE
jgi:predicted transcriptional regulator YdeE/DNA-binding transcriptional MerR regulator